MQGASIYYYQSKQTSSNGIEKHPKLRFPEFSEPWERVRIGDVYAERSERGAVSAELLSVTMTEGVKRRSDIEGKDNSSEDKGNYKVVRIGDMVYNSMRMWQGANGISDYDGIVSPAYTVMKAKRGIANGFFAALFKTHRMIGEFCRHSQGMTSDTWNLKYPQIESIQTYIPTVTEQRKIADMLMYLDRRIEKQHQLLEHLKKYKRGVMCSYFSGKFVLHRSNGQHYSPWREYTLSDVSDEFKSGKSITSTDINEVGEYAVYGGNGVRGYTDHYSHDGQYVVVGRQGALCGNVRIIDGKNYLSEHAIAVKANSNHYTPFLLYLLSDMRLGQYSDQGAQPGLAVNKLLKLKRKFPEYEEQVRFATFMQQIDNKLNSENNKLEYITTLKRGLLQQLFI